MRFSIIYALVLLSLTANVDGTYNYEICGTPSVPKERYVEGKRVGNFELSWIVRVKFALSEEKRNGDQQMFTSCSGTLITTNHVLTVAHCLPPNFKNLSHAITVELIGASADVNRPLTYNVIKVKMYEKYLVSKPGNDIALLELEGEVPDEIHHVCLPTSRFEYDQENDVIYLSGTKNRTDGSNGVKPVEAELGKRNLEYQTFEGEFDVKSVNNTAGCHGDSGAGAISILNGRHVLVGLHVAGSCSIEGYKGPAVSIFTDVVSHFTDIVVAVI